jgi:hypothetical protein
MNSYEVGSRCRDGLAGLLLALGCCALFHRGLPVGENAFDAGIRSWIKCNWAFGSRVGKPIPKLSPVQDVKLVSVADTSDKPRLQFPSDEIMAYHLRPGETRTGAFGEPLPAWKQDKAPVRFAGVVSPTNLLFRILKSVEVISDEQSHHARYILRPVAAVIPQGYRIADRSIPCGIEPERSRPESILVVSKSNPRPNRDAKLVLGDIGGSFRLSGQPVGCCNLTHGTVRDVLRVVCLGFRSNSQIVGIRSTVPYLGEGVGSCFSGACSRISALLRRVGLTNKNDTRNSAREKQKTSENHRPAIESQLPPLVFALFFLLLTLVSFYFIQSSIDDKAFINIWRMTFGMLFFVAGQCAGYLSLPGFGL